jgi:PadR family transcriptional regulator PadR
LKNEDLISSRWEEKDSGLPRKYYGVTDKGRAALAEARRSWLTFNASLERLMEEGL